MIVPRVALINCACHGVVMVMVIGHGDGDGHGVVRFPNHLPKLGGDPV